MNERWYPVMAGAGGSLIIAVGTSPGSTGFGLIPVTASPGSGGYHALGWAAVVAILPALLLIRWWPHLVAAGGLLTSIIWLSSLTGSDLGYVPYATGYPMVVIGVLGGAQSLIGGRRTGAGSVVAALSSGALVFGAVFHGGFLLFDVEHLRIWHAIMLVAGLAAVVPALLHWWRGDAGALGSLRGPWWQWRRLRPALTAGVAMAVPLPLAGLGTERLADLLGVSVFALERHGNAQTAVIGASVLVLVAVLAGVAGPWSLAGGLTAATMLVAICAPVLLGMAATRHDGPAGWMAALAGVAVGVVVAATRWRVAGAVVLIVGAATTVYVAWSATSGEPEKLATQEHLVPGLVLLVTMSAAGTAGLGAIAPALARAGAVPAVLGPFTMVLFTAGMQTLQVTFVNADGLPESTSINAVGHLDSAAFLLLVAGAGVAGTGVAQYLTERWEERKRAGQIRREAAAAERDRLARPIHDGVLQVLAMVQRGEAGGELAALAGEQEVALRNLLRGGGSLGRTGGKDFDVNAALALPGVELSAPATPVMLPAKPAGELVAAVRAALDNVRRHAGDRARVWILLEDENDGVRVTVRDDGAGIAPGRLEEAARSGRLGVSQSMRGRIADLGGTTAIHSAPGEGTEVEFWVPRR
ncbi:ATP-binding protein [Actinoplanes xinjiangensis]|uniref:ATP-binding protein n=1 Tax=Actinoplanes xinjiangensis TaxID=512350 RepID=UPI0034477F95